MNTHDNAKKESMCKPYTYLIHFDYYFRGFKSDICAMVHQLTIDQAKCKNTVRFKSKYVRFVQKKKSH